MKTSTDEIAKGKEITVKRLENENVTAEKVLCLLRIT